MIVPRLGSRWTRPLAFAAMATAMVIFGSNFAISRYAVRHGLTPPDLVALRFGVSGFVMLPFVLRLGLRDCAGIGWRRGAILAATSGAPMTLLVNFGLLFAPASHGSALGPGTVTIVGIVYAAILVRALPPLLGLAGLSLAFTGLCVIALAGSGSGSSTILFGDALFIATGLLWGFYPVLLHRWRVPGIVGAAVCSVLSLAYLPIYLLVLEPRILDVGWSMLAVQVVNQGLVQPIIGLWLWGHGVRVLGASGTSLFPPLIPVVGTLSAVPILAEWPGPLQALGILLIVCGLGLSSVAARLRARRGAATIKAATIKDG